MVGCATRRWGHPTPGCHPAHHVGFGVHSHLTVLAERVGVARMGGTYVQASYGLFHIKRA